MVEDELSLESALLDSMTEPLCANRYLCVPLQFTLSEDSDAGVEEFRFVDSFMPPSGVHLQYGGSLCHFVHHHLYLLFFYFHGLVGV